MVFGPHPDGVPQPDLSTGYPHPEVQLRLVRDGREVQGNDAEGGVLEMKCGALMTHYHKLPDVTAKAMTADDIAESIYWATTLPAHVNVNKIQLMATTQAIGPFDIHREH